MALFGGERDISLFRHLNRELLRDIITQQCVYYKFNVVETRTNMYGEAAHAKFYNEPVILNALIERSDQEYPVDEMLGVNFQWGADFKFFRDDLVEADLVPDVGDIIMYNEGYYEVDSVIANQYFAGKNPLYPYNDNPLNPGLEKFGSSISITCATHYTPADKVQITKERL
tara:strand:- start:111 stop:623 length:513 start_codon:yes stop_codon:yes gene_type:complete